MGEAKEHIRKKTKHVEFELIEPGDMRQDLIVEARMSDWRAIRKAGFREGEDVVLVTKETFDEYLRLKKRIKAIEDRGMIVMA